jgi:hypothetical protein
MSIMPNISFSLPRFNGSGQKRVGHRGLFGVIKKYLLPGMFTYLNWTIHKIDFESEKRCFI